MKNYHWISLFLFFSILFFFMINERSPNKRMISNDIEINNFEEEENKETSIAGRFEHEFDMTHDPSTNTIPSERLAKARKVMMDKFSEEAAIPYFWEERGPNNVGGRTRALLFDANDSTGETVWAGSVGGGLWKTTQISNNNPNWTKVDDFFENIAITTIAQSPSNPDTMFLVLEKDGVLITQVQFQEKGFGGL